MNYKDDLKKVVHHYPDSESIDQLILEMIEEVERISLGVLNTKQSYCPSDSLETDRFDEAYLNLADCMESRRLLEEKDYQKLAHNMLFACVTATQLRMQDPLEKSLGNSFVLKRIVNALKNQIGSPVAIGSFNLDLDNAKRYRTRINGLIKKDGFSLSIEEGCFVLRNIPGGQ